MKTKNLRQLYVLCGLGILMISCATRPDLYKDMELAVSRDDYEGGIAAIKAGQEAKKPVYPESNAISLRLDKGLLEHYAGNYYESAQDLTEAERLMEEAYTKSISEAAASYIVNDNTREYPGEDYEDIYISVFNALNYYHMGDIGGALVEIRKLTHSGGKLDTLSLKYENARKSAGTWLLEQLEKLGFTLNEALPQGETVNFTDSALARYLSVLFYLAERNYDSARIEHEMLLETFSGSPKIYYHSPPGFIPEMRNIPQGKARLHIIGFAGLSPIKEEGQFEQFFPFFRHIALQRPQFKLPMLVPRASQGTHNIRVSSSTGGGSIFLELIEDMGAVMAETFRARFGNIFFKTYIRTMLKYAAADIGARAAEKKTGALAAQIIALAAQKALYATESADVRMARFFPDKAYVGYMDLEPGIHNVTVDFGGGAIKEFNGLDVREGGLNLIQAVSLSGAPTGENNIRIISPPANYASETAQAAPAQTAQATSPAQTAPEAPPTEQAMQAVSLSEQTAPGKPRLLILRFTGAPESEDEKINSILSVQTTLNSEYEIVPLSREAIAFMLRPEYRSSPFIYTPVAAGIGRMLNADYVISGYLRPMGDRNLAVISIIHVESAAIVGGSYRMFGSLEELQNILPGMTDNLNAASKRSISGLPILAAESNAEGRHALIQLLLIDLTNTGKFIVRTSAASAAYVLRANGMNLEDRNALSVQILNAKNYDIFSGGNIYYNTFKNGMEQLPRLVIQLLD